MLLWQKMTLSKWLLLLCLAHNCLGFSSVPYGQYKFALFSMEDAMVSPLPRTNKFVILKENITLLAQLTPARGQDDSANSRLVEHFFWAGAAPHLTLTSANRTVHLPFAVQLYRRGLLVAWRCQFARSGLMGDLSDATGGQWSAELSLSRGSGFFATRASLTDIRFVAWSAWPWGRPVAAATVAARVGRLRYLQDACGGHLGLVLALTAADRPAALVATAIGNAVTWYDLTAMELIRAAFNRTGDPLPADLSLTSGVMTSAHLLLLTSHGLLVSPAFRRRQPGLITSPAFVRLQLRTADRPLADQVKDELIHSPSCFSNREDNETVLLLLHSERRYLLGRAPFHQQSSWRDIRTLVPGPDALTAVSDVRYIWHWPAIFLGYDRGDMYETMVLPLDRERVSRRRPGDSGTEQVKQPYVLLCPLTKKVYLLTNQMFFSVDGGATFEAALSNVTFGRVEHCVTDLISYHICITRDMDLLVIGLGSDEPEKVALKDVIPDMNLTDAAKTALIMDQAGGVTVYGAGPSDFSSHYFNMESGLPEQLGASCEYSLELLGGVRHSSVIPLDVHDIVTVEAEARGVTGGGGHAEPFDPDSLLMDLELSDPAVVHVQRSSSVQDGALRLSATVRPNAWRAGAVCAVTFRLAGVSAVCSHSVRVVNFALSPMHHAVAVDVPGGRDPKLESDVLNHVQAEDNSFIQLPVNYRPPSDRGIHIPTSENIYNADPSQPINNNLLIEHDVSRNTGRYKACAGKATRRDCGCTKAEEYSTDVQHSDCRVYVPVRSWPARLRLTMSIQGSDGLKRPLQAPVYVNITELNSRSSWENHVLLDSDLAYIYQQNLSSRDRQMVDPQRIRILIKGTGLYHFRIQVVAHTSFSADYDDLLVYVIPARLMSQVQNVVYPMVGITLIIIMFVVFEYYHQRYVDSEDDDTDSESEEEQRDDIVTMTHFPTGSYQDKTSARSERT